MEAGKCDDAEADFQAVLDGPPTPEKVNAHYNLGSFTRSAAIWRDAEREFSLAIADSPDNTRDLPRARSRPHEARATSKGALEDFLAVLKEEPQDPVANYQAAICLLSSGRRDLAERTCSGRSTPRPRARKAGSAKRWSSRTSPRPAGGQIDELRGRPRRPSRRRRAPWARRSSTRRARSSPASATTRRPRSSGPTSRSGWASCAARPSGRGSARSRARASISTKRRVLTAHVKAGYFVLVVFAGGPAVRRPGRDGRGSGAPRLRDLLSARRQAGSVLPGTSQGQSWWKVKRFPSASATVNCLSPQGFRSRGSTTFAP